VSGRFRQHPALLLPRRVLRFSRALRCVAWRSLRDVVACFEDFGLRPPGRTAIWIRGLEYPIQLRNGTSDFAVFTQVFLMRQYDLPIVPNAEIIIDAGANVGLASLFFLWRNPKVRIVSIEPDAENYEIACENLAPFANNCRVVHGALWSESRTLALSRGTFRDGRHWASQTLPDENASSEHVRAYTVDEILSEAAFDHIDLLKVDIEGAELQVFRDGSTSFMDRTRCCAVECHGKVAAQAFLDAATAHGFATRRQRELTVAEK
jgi:FkbM family methyltransferase